MSTTGTGETRVFRVKLTASGCKQAPVSYPANLGENAHGGEKFDLVWSHDLVAGTNDAQTMHVSCLTYFKLRVEIPRDTPEANLTKKT